MLRFVCKSAGLASLLFVTACQGQLPPDYSADYMRVPVVSEDGRVKHVLMPKACLQPDPTADTTLGETIPPGCANNWNLQRMVERKRDLFQGRDLGPAPAAPSVRAAENYLNGKKTGATGGGVNDGGAAIISSEAPPEAPKQVSTQNR
jgi:hypothetical protein